MQAAAAVLLTLAAGALASLPVPPNLATSVLLTDAAREKGAVCLDGTPQRYWIQKTNSTVNATKWYIHMHGGAWCESLDACAERAYGHDCYLGSSREICYSIHDNIGTKFSNQLNFGEIPCCMGARWCGSPILNNSKANPLAWDWNKVLIRYCDGGSFSGNNETVTETVYNGQTVKLYFRGARNLEAIIDSLIKDHGIGEATEVMVGGSSAGGLATYMHIDYYAERLPNAMVLGVPDSGFFYNGGPHWNTSLRWVVDAMNSTSSLNQACVEHYRSTGQDISDCAFPEVASKFIKTPLFVMNSKYDPALTGICCRAGDNPKDIQAIGETFVSLVKSTVLDRPNNAAFIGSCREHCGGWGTNSTGLDADFDIVIDGTRAPQALEEWYRAIKTKTTPTRQLWNQEASYPCKDCCNGGQH